MFPYLIFYLLTFTILFFNSRKLRRLLFILIWFIFVGFRDGIGVDYYSTLEVFERQLTYLSLSDSLTGYAFFDSELIYKIIAIFFDFFQINSELFFITLASIKGFFIYKILKLSQDDRLVILIISLIFLLHYPMNAMRQGLCLIIFSFHIIYYYKFDKTHKTSLVLASLSHYASLPAIFLSKFKLNFKMVLIFSLVFFVILNVVDISILKARYSLDKIDQFTFQGTGFKIIIFTILGIFSNSIIQRKKLLIQENLVIILLSFLTLIFNPIFRLFYFYLYALQIKNFTLYSSIKERNFIESILIFSIPTLLFIFEWQEIFRFVECFDCGNWIPYKLKILN